MWLADRTTAGMNRAVAELAHEPGPDGDADFAEHWLGRIGRLRNTRVGVPGDEDVREGMRKRKAYGGSASRTAFAVLCELMEAEHREEAPARGRLTIEHVMPQKLTDEWKRNLGEGAEEKHGRYRDRLANLTLSGDATNAGMGASTFDAKREVYRNSSIGMTRLIADESEWNEAALERRAEELAQRALARWPWVDLSVRRDPAVQSARLRWRVGDGRWRNENTASQMVLNVAAELLNRDPANARRLSGKAISSNVHPAGRYPPGTTVGTLTMRAVPGHDGHVLYPYEQDYRTSANDAGKWATDVGSLWRSYSTRAASPREFWKFLKDHVGAFRDRRILGGAHRNGRFERAGRATMSESTSATRTCCGSTSSQARASRPRKERIECAVIPGRSAKGWPTSNSETTWTGTARTARA